MDQILETFLQQTKETLIPQKFGEPVYIQKETERIIQKYDVEIEQPSPTDLNQLIAKVRKHGIKSILRRDLSWVPWILHFGNRPWLIEQTDILQEILSHFGGKIRSSYLSSLIHVYLKDYHPEIEGTENVRMFIHKHLLAYNGNIQRLKKWKELSILLFPKNGPHITSQWLLKESGNIYISLEKLSFTGDLSNSRFLFQTTKYFLSETIKTFPKHLKKAICLLEVPENKIELRFPASDLIPKIADRFLKMAEINAALEVEDILRPFFLRHLNDPRLPGGRIKWKGITPEAIKVFSQWLSKRDLEFFFNVVDRTAGDPKWKYRHRFWEAYLPYIENTWVVLGKKAKRYVLNSSDIKSHLIERNFGILKGGTYDQSVFLIEMKGFIFVEWSSSGACRILNKNKEQLPFKFGSKEYRREEFTHTEPEISFRHIFSENYKWQEKMRRWIRDNTGNHVKHSDISLDKSSTDTYMNN